MTMRIQSQLSQYLFLSCFYCNKIQKQMQNKDKYSSVQNYLAKSSLFKPRKQRIVSSYVTHQSYFESQQTTGRQNPKSGNIPNVNTTKKIYIKDSVDSLPQKLGLNSKRGILKPTVKKSVESDINQDIKEKTEINNQDASVISNDKIQFLSFGINKNDKNKQENSSNSELPTLKKQILQTKKDNLNPSIHLLNRSDTEILYSDTQMVEVPIDSPALKTSSKNKKTEFETANIEKPSANQSDISTSKIQQPYNKNMNPYIEDKIIQRSKQNLIKNRASKSFDRLIPSSSVAPQSILILDTPRQTIQYSLSSQNRKQTQTESDNRNYYFDSTKKDINNYLFSVKLRLNARYSSLQSLEVEIDHLIGKEIELECQKIRASLIRLIDCQLLQIKEMQMRELNRRKFDFMADLYEIKCNIDLRLQEISDYEHTLTHQDKWKKVVSHIITPNYEENIKFIFEKADQIQNDVLQNSTQYLTAYAMELQQEIMEKLKVEIRQTMQANYQEFASRKKKIYSFIGNERNG